MLRRLAALTGLSAAALMAMTATATAEVPTTDDGIGLTYGVTTAAIDLTTGVTNGALTMAGANHP